MSEPFESEDALLRGLGRTVQAASHFDRALQMLFCALMGSKYAAVVAAGQTTDWLCGSCMALLKVHKELAPEHKDRLIALLKEGKAAADRRNRLVHDRWAGDPMETFLIRSRRGTHELAMEPLSLEAVESVARVLTRVSVGLVPVLFEALGPDATTLEAQLRWEDYLASLSPEELAAMAERRKQALLDEERHASGD
jgi:hypothetical protein